MSLDSRRNSKLMMLPGVRREPYRNRFKSDLEGLTPALTAARGASPCGLDWEAIWRLCRDLKLRESPHVCVPPDSGTG
jgi:hypothetical protein